MRKPANTERRSSKACLGDRKLIFITGKGGTGKSTVACALGLAAAKKGKKTLVCELSGNAHIYRQFGEINETEHEFRLADRLWGTTIELESSLKEWVGDQVRPRAIANLLSSSATFQYFAAAVPGAKEMVVLRKLLRVVEEELYDLVIVDAPASGHGIGLLRTPWTFAEIVQKGPLFNQIDRVRELLLDSERTGYLAVALAAEMPVSETIELSGQLNEQPGITLDGVVVNSLYPQRFSKPEIELLDSLVRSHDDRLDRSTLSSISAAKAESRRALDQRKQLARLRRQLPDAPTTTIPFVFEHAEGMAATQAAAKRMGTLLSVDR